ASSRSEGDAVGNSPGVRRELTNGIGSLPGWHKGVHRKKTETRQKIVRGSQKTCQELERPLMGAELPKSTVELLIPYFQGAFDGCTTGAGR
ncbi:hypothetical protein GW17_00034282, partial [Ensete ventricosum]